MVKLSGKGVQWFCDSCIKPIRTAIKGGDGHSSGDDINALSHCAMINQKLQDIENLVSTMSTALSTNKVDVEERFEKLESSYADAMKQNAESVKKTMEINESANRMVSKQLEISQAELRKNNAILYGIKVDDQKSAFDQIKELMHKECFLKTTGPLRAV